MTAGELTPESLLSGILEGIGQPFYAVDRHWRIILYNSDAARHFGRPASEMLGRKLWDVFPDDVHAERGRIIFDAMERRTTVKGEALSMVGPWVAYCMFPLGDGLGVIFRDVTDRRRAQEHREAAELALQRRTAELEAVLEMIPTAVWFTYDPLARVIVTNRRASDLLRLPPGANASLSAPQTDRPRYRFYKAGVEVMPENLPMQRAVRGETAEDEVLELRFDNGDSRILLIRAATLRDADGAIQGAVAAAADVTERHRYEDHLRLLLDELNHRVKNTLAIVQSLAFQTLRNADNVEEARGRLEARLLALAGAHDILTRERWQRTSLRQVIEEAVAPYAGADGHRFVIEGPEVAIRPKNALALAMALHELCTNAVKYGALSVEPGSVSIVWRVDRDGDGDRLSLSWTEQGGPAVLVPERRGFGSRLVEQGLPHDLGGKVQLHFDPAGLVCHIEAPLPADSDIAAEIERGADLRP